MDGDHSERPTRPSTGPFAERPYHRRTPTLEAGMSSRARPSGVAILVALIALTVGACAGAAPSASSGASAAPTPVAARTPGPTGAPELAAMLPDRAGGQDFV